MEEKKLVEGCIRGESWAQKRVYELYAPLMMSVCQRYLGNRETARDLLHDGFVKLFTKIQTYSGQGSFQGWMRRIFVTTALEYLRHNDILRYSIDIYDVEYIVEDTSISVLEHLSADDLFTCVSALPSGFRTVFNMYVIEGYSHAEIAEMLNIAEGTSRSQYARARQMLQKMISHFDAVTVNDCVKNFDKKLYDI